METWLKPNQRVLLLFLTGPVILSGLAVWLFWLATPIYFWAGVVLLALAAALTLVIFLRTLRRRLAYRSGTLVVDLGPGKPIPVPIDAVECFFLGSSKTTLSGRLGIQSRAVSVVVRLAEKAVEFHDRSVSPGLGSWSEGYITIRGSWCEPVSPALIAKLNSRLIEAKRSVHSADGARDPNRGE